MAAGISILIQEWVQDGDYTHFALAAVAPLVFCVSLFFTIQLTNTVSYVYASYSFHPPRTYCATQHRSNSSISSKLQILFCGPAFASHTIADFTPHHDPDASLQGEFGSNDHAQCHELEESHAHLCSARQVSSRFLRVRHRSLTCSFFNCAGGTSSIFINDDGLQLLSEQDRDERIEFYATHGIGWVARPPHSEDTPRAGRFKKVYAPPPLS